MVHPFLYYRRMMMLLSDRRARSVLVALDEEGLVGRGLGASHVLAEVGLRVGLRAGEQGLLGGGHVLGLALPSLWR